MSRESRCWLCASSHFGYYAFTPAAFEAISATLPLGSVGYEPELNAKGERLIWLEEIWLNKLRDAWGRREQRP